MGYYRDSYEDLVWGNFFAAKTARGAIASFLFDSAAVLTGCVAGIPLGCMVALSSVGSEGHVELGELVRSARSATLERLEARLKTAMADGEIPASCDVHALARFAQTVQFGMSILARDGASRAELDAVAELSMLGWDGRIGGGKSPA